MTDLDKIVTALCAWKEARGGGIQGMQSVINVIMNRVAKNKSTAYAVVFAPFQFSSMTYHNDPQLLKQPDPDDTAWMVAQNLVTQASVNALADITGGATFYYAKTISEPVWAKSMIQTVEIGNQLFFKEVA